MPDTAPPSPSVVVGIDGSHSALTAALWAVEEAVERDIPLRLIYAIQPRGELTAEAAASDLSAAETAVRMALMAVESTGKPVKVEVEMLQGSPTEVLLQAGRAAEMICVGVVGLKSTIARRVGSTSAAVATWARCPVAVIRGCDPTATTPGSVVVEIDRGSNSDAVLERGAAEAVLRDAPLVVVSVWQSSYTDVHESGAVAERNHLVRAELSRRVARTIRAHPDLDVQLEAVHGTLLTYLSLHAESTQLVVVGRRRAHGVTEMVGPPSCAALHDSACSVLVCDGLNSL